MNVTDVYHVSDSSFSHANCAIVVYLNYFVRTFVRVSAELTNFPRDWVRDSEFRGPELFSPLSYLRSEGAYGIRNSDPMHI